LPFGLLKRFAREKMIWPFGHLMAFLNVKESSMLKPVLEKYEQNLKYFKKF